jgi:hypothetical protein
VLTNDKTITTPEYWNKVYAGKNDNAAVDASNTVRPANPFDRFGWVARYAEGPTVLDIGSGHAHICKRIKAAHPSWGVIASDQSAEARKAAYYEPYLVINGYDIVFPRPITTVICSQCLEYFEKPDRLLKKIVGAAKFFLCTVPIGEMAKWSQLRVYTEENFRPWIEQYGRIQVWEREGDLLLCKIKIYD